MPVFIRTQLLMIFSGLAAAIAVPAHDVARADDAHAAVQVCQQQRGRGVPRKFAAALTSSVTHERDHLVLGSAPASTTESTV